jgi:hypothetical protein
MGRRAGDGGQHGKLSLLDKIMKAYSEKPGCDISDLPLTEAEQHILERWVFIDGLCRRHRPKLKMADIEAMTRNRYHISNSQFWTDWKNTDRLFGSSFARSKEWSKSIYVEWLEQSATLAESRGDYKAQIKAIELAAKLLGLFDKDEQTPPDEEPKQFVMSLMVSDKSSTGLPEIIDLDKLNSMRPDLFEKLINYVDRPNVSENVMAKLLEDNNG